MQDVQKELYKFKVNIEYIKPFRVREIEANMVAESKKIAFINPYISASYMAAYVNAAMAKADEMAYSL